MTLRSPTRRALLSGLAGVVPILASGTLHAADRRTDADTAAEKMLDLLEKQRGGLLGVAVLDIASGRHFAHRGHERFAMCSTFKFLLTAAVLARVDQGLEKAEHRISYGESDLLEYAPVTRQRLKEGSLSISDLCAAVVEVSDNTAANLLLPVIGGPEGLTRYCRSLGDRVTRLDRTEPTLNIVPTGDVRDTTTPLAMLKLMNTILLGKVLSDASRRQLETWLLQATVGQDRIKAGLPPTWRIGHKTGTWETHVNDIAIVWPPGRAPILVTAYYAGPPGPQQARSAVLSEIGRIVSETLHDN
jgi:beta-lactamase class A